MAANEQGESVSHYRSNLRDLEFNLFEVHRVQDAVRGDTFPDLDEATMRQILGEVERLASNEWAASYVDSDRIPIDLVDGEIELPPSLRESLAALRRGGWDRLGASEELGGMVVPPLLFWATQELLLGANAAATFYASGSLFARVLFEEGTDEQKELARLMVERGWAATMVLTEPDAGSDVGAGVAKAIETGDGTWHLEGVKRFITGGEHDAAENIIHLVLARPERAGPGTKGLSLFAVPKYLVNDDGSLGARNGVVATGLEKKMGLKGSTTCELTFGLDSPAVGSLVGGVHDGIRQMFRVIEHARMLIGTKSAATLSTGYLNALEYARERVQGPDMTELMNKAAPRVSIIRHPDVRRMLMTQKAYAEGLRALWVYAASIQHQALVEPADEGSERRLDLLLPLVKGYTSEKAYELLALSLQVLGGSGYIMDFPIEQYIRDAKIDTVYEGTTGIQALDLFFRKIARDQGETLSRLSAEILEFVKGGGGGDPLSAERALLGEMVEAIQTQIGVMVEHLVESMGGNAGQIYKTGLHANALLFSLAEVVIAWRLLAHAEIALPKAGDDPFYEGKVASARYLVADVAPRVAARSAAARDEDGHLMEMSDEAF